MFEKLQNEIHDNALKKGFWEDPVNLGEKLMLIVTEIAEMCEAHRKGNFCRFSLDFSFEAVSDSDFKAYFEKGVKDTFEDEVADAFIRLLDLSKRLGIPLESHIRAKMRYNSLRPFKHGKAY